MTQPSGPEDVSSTELNAFAATVQIVELRPTAYATRLVRDWPSEQEAPEVTVSTQQHMKTYRSPPEAPPAFRVDAELTCLVHLPGNENAIIAQFSYEARCTYLLPPASQLPRERMIDRFAQTSTMTHVWPYFRAHVQTACALLQVRPVLLPATVFALAAGAGNRPAWERLPFEDEKAESDPTPPK